MAIRQARHSESRFAARDPAAVTATRHAAPASDRPRHTVPSPAHESPRLVAQRRQLVAIFGPAIALPRDSQPKDAADVTGKAGLQAQREARADPTAGDQTGTQIRVRAPSRHDTSDNTPLVAQRLKVTKRKKGEKEIKSPQELINYVLTVSPKAKVPTELAERVFLQYGDQTVEHKVLIHEVLSNVPREKVVDPAYYLGVDRRFSQLIDQLVQSAVSIESVGRTGFLTAPFMDLHDWLATDGFAKFKEIYSTPPIGEAGAKNRENTAFRLNHAILWLEYTARQVRRNEVDNPEIGEAEARQGESGLRMAAKLREQFSFVLKTLPDDVHPVAHHRRLTRLRIKRSKALRRLAKIPRVFLKDVK